MSFSSRLSEERVKDEERVMAEPQEIKGAEVEQKERSHEQIDEDGSINERRPYQKPSFISSRAFERQALSCAGCINQASGFPTFCSNQSG